MPEEERVPDGMRHLQERTMLLEDQVKNLKAQVQGQRDEGDGALHPGGRVLGDGRALRGGEPGGDRALQHGRAREDPDGVQGWQNQIDRLEKLLHERHGSGGPTWYQYGSGIPGGHGGDRASMSMSEGLGGLREGHFGEGKATNGGASPEACRRWTSRESPTEQGRASKQPEWPVEKPNTQTAAKLAGGWSCILRPSLGSLLRILF